MNVSWKNLIPFFAIVFLVAAVESAFAFRCNGRLVSYGDTKFEVIAKCGEPSWVEQRTIERVERTYDGPYLDRRPYRNPSLVVIPIEVEEWLYNLGPHRFMRVLTFENGRLVEIETGAYGY